MSGSLQDKIAIVTGGAQGLGEAICYRLAAEGCHLVVADLNEEKAKQTASNIQGRRAIAVKVDVSQEDQVAACEPAPWPGIFQNKAGSGGNEGNLE